MRAQTKAIIASVLVIALALTAVSGVTYSWWSDSESAEITISTGKMELSISENDMKLKAGTEEVTAPIRWIPFSWSRRRPIWIGCG